MNTSKSAWTTRWDCQPDRKVDGQHGELWPLNTGQVYSTLQRLERDALVTALNDDQGPQQRYSITESGRRFGRFASELG